MGEENHSNTVGLDLWSNFSVLSTSQPLMSRTPLMGYAAAGLQRQALFSIALVLFLFIMLINAALNFFLKRSKEK